MFIVVCLVFHYPGVLLCFFFICPFIISSSIVISRIHICFLMQVYVCYLHLYLLQVWMIIHIPYPLVNVYITMENHNFRWGNPL